MQDNLCHPYILSTVVLSDIHNAADLAPSLHTLNHFSCHFAEEKRREGSMGSSGTELLYFSFGRIYNIKVEAILNKVVWWKQGVQYMYVAFGKVKPTWFSISLYSTTGGGFPSHLEVLGGREVGEGGQ